MKTSLPFLLCSIAVLFCSCTTVTSCNTMGIKGSGTEKKVVREVGAFTAVDVSGTCDVEITCQQTLRVEVQGDDNIVPLIKTEVRDGILYISHDKSISPKTALRVLVSVPNVEAFSLSGAGEARVLNVQNEKLSLEVSGAGSVYAAGTTKELHIDVSGATDVEMKELHAQSVHINVSGAADAEIFASETLHAEVSGVGNITYYGNPATVQQEVSGVGSISKK